MTKTLADTCSKIDIPKCTGNLANILEIASRLGTFMGAKEEKGRIRNAVKRRNRICFVTWHSLTWHSWAEWFIARLPLVLPLSTLDTLTSVQPILTKLSLLSLATSRKIITNFTPAFHFSFRRLSMLLSLVDILSTRLEFRKIMKRKFSQVIIDIFLRNSNFFKSRRRPLSTRSHSRYLCDILLDFAHLKGETIAFFREITCDFSLGFLYSSLPHPSTLNPS